VQTGLPARTLSRAAAVATPAGAGYAQADTKVHRRDLKLQQPLDGLEAPVYVLNCRNIRSWCIDTQFAYNIVGVEHLSDVRNFDSEVL
jgi:hypothetical protein